MAWRRPGAWGSESGLGRQILYPPSRTACRSAISRRTHRIASPHGASSTAVRQLRVIRVTFDRRDGVCLFQIHAVAPGHLPRLPEAARVAPHMPHLSSRPQLAVPPPTGGRWILPADDHLATTSADLGPG